MPIFGQVWLWSLAAFLLGALLCWVLVVLPVRRRISTLESRLASLRADAKLSAAAERSRAPEPAGGNPVPGFGDPRDEIRPESLTRAYSLAGVQDAPRPSYEEPAERGALQLTPPPEAEPRPYVPPVEDGPTSGPSGRDWFDEQPAEEPAGQSTGAHRLIEDEDEDDRGTVFTQRTTPIPAELIRSLDDAQPEAQPEPPKPDDSLVDDLADEPAEPEEPPPGLAPLTPPVLATPPEPPRLPSRGANRSPVFEPTLVVKNGSAKSDVDTPAEPAPAPNNRSTIAELPSRAELVEPKVSGGITIEPERAQSALPKRIPAKPRHQYHPFGVETVTPAVSPSTAPASGGERTRSLFEPVIPAEDGQTEVPPPPNRLPAAPLSTSAGGSSTSGGGSRPSAPGPFGPGSAMPLPGGASPSPEFTVKASVTALRYCTPESPQFGRTVAEVWFRTAADAERVGFRPVG
jgi:hypothetical protein